MRVKPEILSNTCTGSAVEISSISSQAGSSMIRIESEVLSDTGSVMEIVDVFTRNY